VGNYLIFKPPKFSHTIKILTLTLIIIIIIIITTTTTTTTIIAGPNG
jgi:hypothetical protein